MNPVVTEALVAGSRTERTSRWVSFQNGAQHAARCSSGIPSQSSRPIRLVKHSAPRSMECTHIDAAVFRPPQVDGRLILSNGAIALILHNRIEEANQTTNASYGRYVLNASGYSYRYEDTSVFTQTSSGVTVSHKAPWEGMRSFSVSNKGQTVVLRAAGGEQFSFSPEGLRYSEKGQVLRVWRRIRQ